MDNVQLHGSMEGVVVGRGRLPGEAVGVVSRDVLGETEGVGARDFQERVGGGVVVRVVDAREHDLGVVAQVVPEVDVASMVPAHTVAL